MAQTPQPFPRPPQPGQTPAPARPTEPAAHDTSSGAGAPSARTTCAQRAHRALRWSTARRGRPRADRAVAGAAHLSGCAIPGDLRRRQRAEVRAVRYHRGFRRDRQLLQDPAQGGRRAGVPRTGNPHLGRRPLPRGDDGLPARSDGEGLHVGRVEGLPEPAAERRSRNGSRRSSCLFLSRPQLLQRHASRSGLTGYRLRASSKTPQRQSSQRTQEYHSAQ